MIAQLGTASINHKPIVTWEPLPKDFQLEDEPVEMMDNRYSQGHCAKA